jgi:dTDP-4-dehydrorhamnose 3,5-epimerase-like enzyme
MFLSMPDSCLIHLPKILDDRGNLSFLENNDQIPFDIKRVYWIYDVPGGEAWGGHAYHQTSELIIALSGSIDIVVDNGVEAKKYSLNRSYTGLYIPPLHWKTMQNFSTNSLALVVTNHFYNPDEYIRNWEEFKQITHA